VATWLHRLFSRQTRDLMAIALVAVGAPSQATLAQTTAPGRRIIHESWTFKQGAPVCASSCSDRRSANDCNAEFLRSMTHDGSGGAWVSFGPLGLYRFKDSVWSKSGRPTRPATLSVVIAFTDALNRVWFGSTQNRLAMLDCDQVRTFGPAERVQVGTIGAIARRGAPVWIGGAAGPGHDRVRYARAPVMVVPRLTPQFVTVS
jgi:hypothetical protein